MVNVAVKSFKFWVAAVYAINIVVGFLFLTTDIVRQRSEMVSFSG